MELFAMEPPASTGNPARRHYPFAARSGESALNYFARWLDEAGYARVEHAGRRYVHEVDVMNVVNHITADVALLSARLDEYGDQVVTAADYTAVIERIEGAIGTSAGRADGSGSRTGRAVRQRGMIGAHAERRRPGGSDRRPSALVGSSTSAGRCPMMSTHHNRLLEPQGMPR